MNPMNRHTGAAVTALGFALLVGGIALIAAAITSAALR